MNLLHRWQLNLYVVIKIHCLPEPRIKANCRWPAGPIMYEYGDWNKCECWMLHLTEVVKVAVLVDDFPGEVSGQPDEAFPIRVRWVWVLHPRPPERAGVALVERLANHAQLALCNVSCMTGGEKRHDLTVYINTCEF